MPEDDLVALLHLLAPELEVHRGGPPEVHDRGDVAQHLLDGAGEQAAVAAQELPLVGVVEEGGHGTRHQVPGGLVPRHDEQHEEEVELELVELLAFHLGVDQYRDQVLAGRQPSFGRQLLGVAEDLHGGLVRFGSLDLVLGVLGTDHAVRPLEDLAPVLLGHAEQLGDDQQWQLGRDLLDEVGRAPFAHGVDDAVGVADDLLLQVAYQFGGEALVDQAPVTGVHGRVHVQHHQLLLGQGVAVHVTEQGGAPGRGEVLPVAVHGDAVVVAGHRPEAAAGGGRVGVPVHRGLVAQLAEPLEGDAGDEIAPVDQVDVLEPHGVHGPPFGRAGAADRTRPC